MPYTTNRISNLRDRVVIDIRSWGLSIWKRISMWSFGITPSLCFGPFEIFHHTDGAVADELKIGKRLEYYWPDKVDIFGNPKHE